MLARTLGEACAAEEEEARSVIDLRRSASLDVFTCGAGQGGEGGREGGWRAGLGFRVSGSGFRI